MDIHADAPEHDWPICTACGSVDCLDLEPHLDFIREAGPWWLARRCAACGHVHRDPCTPQEVRARAQRGDILCALERDGQRRVETAD